MNRAAGYILIQRTDIPVTVETGPYSYKSFGETHTLLKLTKITFFPPCSVSVKQLLEPPNTTLASREFFCVKSLLERLLTFQNLYVKVLALSVILSDLLQVFT